MTSIQSPCTGVCRLDAASGWCFGCGRTGGEITAWMTADNSAKRAILAALPARMKLMASKRKRRASKG